MTPAEIVFSDAGERRKLRVLARWSDGSVEDVTPLCRYQTNDESVLRPVSSRTGPDYPDVPTPTKIDQLVTVKLRKLGIVPSEICSDAEFLRRVSLDMQACSVCRVQQ